MPYIKFIIKKSLIILNCRGRVGVSNYNIMKTSMLVSLQRKNRTAELYWFAVGFHCKRCPAAVLMLSHRETNHFTSPELGTVQIPVQRMALQAS